MRDPNLTVGFITALTSKSSGAAASDDAFAVAIINNRISATAPAAFVRQLRRVGSCWVISVLFAPIFQLCATPHAPHTVHYYGGRVLIGC